MSGTHVHGRRLRLLALFAASVVAPASSSCGEDTGGVNVVENTPPNARIEGPIQVARGDLVRFDGSSSTDADGRVITHLWDFGDGTAGADGSEVFHSYNGLGRFELALTVTDDREGSDTATQAIEVVEMIDQLPPIARIAAPARIDVGENVIFDGSASTDPDGQIAFYEWEIGAAGPTPSGSGLSQVSHTFVAAGTQTIVLTVTDDNGAKATATHTIIVGGAGQRAPVADAGADQSTGVGQAVQFDGAASFDPDGTIVDYRWDFGDGSTAVGQTAAHTYNVENSFVVTLTVEDNDGLTSVDTTTITVGTVDIDGTYTMEANPSTGTCAGFPATFVATTVDFISNGSMLTVTQPDPENPANPDIPMTGTITGANFTVSGTWQDSSTAVHDVTFSGVLGASGYTGTFREAVSLMGLGTICTLDWAVSGSKL